MATTNNNLATANLAALNAELRLQTDGATLPSVGSVAVKVTGNWTGTLAFEATVDGTNFDSVNVTPLNSSGGPVVTTTTANGLWGFSVFGYQAVRVRASAWTSGTAVVTLDGTQAALPTQPLAAIATLSSNQGGPPLATGISIATGASGSNATAGSDPSRNLQGKGAMRVAINPTLTGDTTLVFLDNPWTQGLDLNDTILLSGGINGGAREEVIVSLNNTPSAAAAPTTVNLQSPVVFPGSTAATFDNFALTGPPADGATVMGIPVQSMMLYDQNAPDPKRPMKILNQAPGAPGVASVLQSPDPLGSSDATISRRLLEQILLELRAMNLMIAQLKDPGSMDVPAGIFISSYDSPAN